MMKPVHGQTETVLSNYRPQEGPDQVPNRLPAWKYAPMAGKAEGACILSGSTPSCPGDHVPDWTVRLRTMTAHAT